jgi:hypothetical protein
MSFTPTLFRNVDNKYLQPAKLGGPHNKEAWVITNLDRYQINK